MESDTYQGVLHLIFHRGWSDVSGICHKIAEKCDRFLAAQHNADDKVKTTHVHCAIENFRSDNKIPVEGLRTFLPAELKGRGQYVIMKKTEKSKKFYHYETLCIYIIKASVLNVKLVRNLSPVKLDELASQWINHSEPVKRTPKTEECSKTHWEIIQEVKEEINKQPKDKINPYTGGLTGEYSFELVYRMLLVVLKKYRIRTSRNELERFMITIIRDDYNFEDQVMLAIKKNIFRDN